MAKAVTGLEAFLWGLYDSAFDREPDAGGLQYWLDELSSGRMGLLDVARHFVASQEFTDLHAGRPAIEMIRWLYSSSFGRTPSNDEVDWWVGYAAEGHSLVEIVAGFAYSQEQQKALALGLDDPGPVTPPIEPPVPPSPPTPSVPPAPDDPYWAIADLNKTFTILEDEAFHVRYLGPLVEGALPLDPRPDWDVLTDYDEVWIKFWSHWGRVELIPDQDVNGVYVWDIKGVNPITQSTVYGTITIDIVPVNDAPRVTSHQSSDLYLRDAPLTFSWLYGYEPYQTFTALGETLAEFKLWMYGDTMLGLYAVDADGSLGALLLETPVVSSGSTLELVDIDLRGFTFEVGKSYGFKLTEEPFEPAGVGYSPRNYYAGGVGSGLVVTDADIAFHMEFANTFTVTNDGTEVAIFRDLAIVDVDSDELEWASIFIRSKGLDDELHWSHDTGLDVTWDAEAGTLYIEGTSAADDYLEVLRSITFSTDGIWMQPREIVLTLSDGEADVSLIGAMVAIQAV